jgi:hypothetical protein
MAEDGLLLFGNFRQLEKYIHFPSKGKNSGMDLSLTARPLLRSNNWISFFPPWSSTLVPMYWGNLMCDTFIITIYHYKGCLKKSKKKKKNIERKNVFPGCVAANK